MRQGRTIYHANRNKKKKESKAKQNRAKKRQEKKREEKKTGVSILTSDKLDDKPKNVIKRTQYHSKGTIHMKSKQLYIFMSPT